MTISNTIPVFKEVLDDGEVRGFALALIAFLASRKYSRPPLEDFLCLLRLDRLQEAMGECFDASDGQALEDALENGLSEFGYRLPPTY